MATPDDTGDAFIREVDDEYRREKLGRFWSRYGRLVFVGVGALLLGVAGYLYWRGWKADQADARAQSFSAAIADARAGQAAKAEPAFGALSNAPEPGYRALAALERAGTLAATDPAKAIAAYDAAANDADFAPPFRDLARLKSVQLAFDRLTPAQIVDRLHAMALPGNPWFGTAGELTALAQMRAGRPDLARPILATLTKEESVPPSIRARAQQLLASMAPAGGTLTPTADKATVGPGAPTR